MIPKIIHYCWFGGGEKPAVAKKCIESWKKFCPDFEIHEWNEDNCDYLAIPFMAEAYQAKKICVCFRCDAFDGVRTVRRSVF